MSFIGTLFSEGLIRPLFNALIAIYEVIPLHDFGIAIILLTIIIRVILFPLSHKALRSQKILTELQPRIKEIQKKHHKNSTEQTQAMMALYKEYGANPFSPFLFLLVQLPLLFALYQVFANSLKQEFLSHLYSFTPFTNNLQPMFLGLIDLSLPHPVLAVAAGLAQFVQIKSMNTASKTNVKEANPMAQMMGGPMLYIMPLFIAGIALKLPAGLSLYWITMSLFSFFEQYSIKRRTKQEQEDVRRDERVSP